MPNLAISDIMTRNVRFVSPDTPACEAAMLMRDEDVGSVPVVENGQLAGIITDRDIAIRLVAERKDHMEPVGGLMSQELITAAPGDSIERVAQIMQERQIRRLPIVENGRLVGIVALGDLAVQHDDDLLAGETLEEISEGVKVNQ